MARIDVPTLQCDRCMWATTDVNGAMQHFRKARIDTVVSGSTQKYDEYDLCKQCVLDFETFIANKHIRPVVI